MSTTNSKTSTQATIGVKATDFAPPKTESMYMKFKNKRVKELIHNSKQPESIYPGILSKRDAGRIAKFEWDRDNEKTPFQRYSGVRTTHFKDIINKIFPDSCYPEITEVPPPAVDRKALGAEANGVDGTENACVLSTKLACVLPPGVEANALARLQKR